MTSRSEPHGAGVRGELAEDQLDEGRLARAVGADQPDPIPTHDPQREPLDERPRTEAFTHCIELGHQVA